MIAVRPQHAQNISSAITELEKNKVVIITFIRVPRHYEGFASQTYLPRILSFLTFSIPLYAMKNARTIDLDVKVQ